jgi:WD40 repeat protein
LFPTAVFSDCTWLFCICIGLVNLWRISSLPLKPILDLEGKNEDNQNMSKSKGTTTTTKDDDSASVFTNADRKKEDMENTDMDQDVCVDTMELNDSVYSLAWSAADPWVYAALCYDGTVAIRSVPSKEKYKILL